MTMTGNDRFSIQDILPFLLKKKKFVQVTGALLHFDSLFCTFAPAIERKLLLHRKSVFTDDTFECAGKKLCIYPDGGFMNGWFIYNAPGERKMYDLSTITYDTEIDICRNQDIKFDVTIEDI